MSWTLFLVYSVQCALECNVVVVLITICVPRVPIILIVPFFLLRSKPRVESSVVPEAVPTPLLFNSCSRRVRASCTTIKSL